MARTPVIWHQLPAGRLPKDHPLVGVRVACEECNALCKEAGSRDSRITWVETGFMASCVGDGPEHLESQNYCIMHFGGRGDVYPELDAKFLLDD